MELNLVPISITRQKQDPAWNHCEVFKNGGGIHRFKEHLAGRKGQGPICEQVPQGVRSVMQESLNGILVKQDKKQKLIPKLLACGSSSSNLNIGGEVENLGSHDDMNFGIKPISVLNTLEDNRWEQQRHLPLYAAGFFLNPKFFYNTEEHIHNDILSAVFDSIERLVPDTNIQDQVVREINLYKNAMGDLGRPMAVRARDNLLPEKDSLDPLVFNSKDILEDWIADNEVSPDNHESSDWKSLDPPVGNRTTLTPPGDEAEDFLSTRFMDLDIFNGLKGVKEEI
ncbi:uncharacterized protein F383_05780 [Gossypium arboreum]|uniref:Uncharacterized protein n=1 Tax=Gossypium arboreum TaxID=29729 RepID=A0A0B0P678_GOSAR|nr:uncharacterized protein F383_05780 [Gossypium arboreum]